MAVLDVVDAEKQLPPMQQLVDFFCHTLVVELELGLSRGQANRGLQALDAARVNAKVEVHHLDKARGKVCAAHRKVDDSISKDLALRNVKADLLADGGLANTRQTHHRDEAVVVHAFKDNLHLALTPHKLVDTRYLKRKSGCLVHLLYLALGERAQHGTLVAFLLYQDEFFGLRRKALIRIAPQRLLGTFERTAHGERLFEDECVKGSTEDDGRLVEYFVPLAHTDYVLRTGRMEDVAGKARVTRGDEHEAQLAGHF